MKAFPYLISRSPHMNGRVAAALAAMVILGSSAAQATVYYYKGTGAPNSLSSWNTAVDGSGANATAFGSTHSFIVQAGQTMTITNAFTTTNGPSALTVQSGAIVNSGAFNPTITLNLLSGATYNVTNTTYSNLNSGSVFEAGSTFTYSGSSATYTDRGWGNLNWYSSAAGATTFGNMTTKGTFNLDAAGEVRLTNANSYTWNVGGDLLLGSTLNLASGVGTGVLNIAGGFTNDGGLLTKTNTGGSTINFNGSGTSSATWGTITSGTNFNLTIGTGKTINFQDSGLNTGTGTLGVSGTMGMGANNATVGGTVSLTGGAITGSGVLTGGGYAVQSGSASASLAGGTAALTKTSAGLVLLTGTNTYGGPTSIQAGTLVVNGTNSGTGVVTVDHGATLAGIGTIAGATTISGTHSVGHTANNGIGTQTFSSSLTYTSDSTFSWQLGGETTTGAGQNFDAVTVGGGLDVEGGVFRIVVNNLDLDSSFWASNKTWDIFGSSGGTGTFSSYELYDANNVGYTYASYGSFSFNAGSGQLSWSVPEPTNALAGLLIGAGLLRRRRARIIPAN